jgi:hypothetical protein
MRTPASGRDEQARRILSMQLLGTGEAWDVLSKGSIDRCRRGQSETVVDFIVGKIGLWSGFSQ